MIAIADTSPLHYLILLGVIDELPQLFDPLLAPPAVLTELIHPRAPEAVRQWARTPAPWLHVRPPVRPVVDLPPRLGAGERDALALRAPLAEGVLLLDGREASVEASRRGWAVLGTLGLLRALAVVRPTRLDLPDALARLRATSFRVTDGQLAAVLRAAQGD